MATRVDVRVAENQLSELVDQVESGEEFVITRSGRSVARLVPMARPPFRRQPGSWEGEVWTADDFDETPEEIIDEWYSKLDAGE